MSEDVRKMRGLSGTQSELRKHAIVPVMSPASHNISSNIIEIYSRSHPTHQKTKATYISSP